MADKAVRLVCPQCGAVAVQLNYLRDYWNCVPSIGGCNALFDGNDSRLTGQIFPDDLEGIAAMARKILERLAILEVMLRSGFKLTENSLVAPQFLDRRSENLGGVPHNSPAQLNDFMNGPMAMIPPRKVSLGVIGVGADLFELSSDTPVTCAKFSGAMERVQAEANDLFDRPWQSGDVRRMLHGLAERYNCAKNAPFTIRVTLPN